MQFINTRYICLLISTCVLLVECEDVEKEKVVLVSPVLAPPSNSRARVSDTAKDFPVLMLLSNNGYSSPAVIVGIERDPQPIYVEKLEDQKRLRDQKLSRRKRNRRLNKKGKRTSI